jgi:hypothetical protein
MCNEGGFPEEFLSLEMEGLKEVCAEMQGRFESGKW